MTSQQDDEKWMLMALLEGRRAQGKSYPNPPVGAVLVKDGKLLSTGHTQSNGSHHAEIDCIRACLKEPHGATLYVSLEPCSHVGRTGRCTDAIKQSRIDRVVVGLTDPNPRVAGSGIRQLRIDGIKVDSGILAEQCSIDLEEYLWRARNGFEKGFSEHSAQQWNIQSSSWMQHLSTDRWAQTVIHQDSLRVELGDLNGLEVLDFGGGHGDISAVLCEMGAIVTYTDQSQAMLEAAARRNAEQRRFRVLTAAEFNQQKRAARYDVIVASMVLHDVEYA